VKKSISSYYDMPKTISLEKNEIKNFSSPTGADYLVNVYYQYMPGQFIDGKDKIVDQYSEKYMGPFDEKDP